jgi:rSAM/selenodomain-associated transferase 1
MLALMTETGSTTTCGLKSTFGLFVKYPEPGRVKTRLAGAIGDTLAAELYVAFLDDLVARFRDIDARRVLAYTPNHDRSRDYFERLADGAFELWAQSDGSLGERIESFFDAFGPEPVVVVGSDSPTLPRRDVEHALAALNDKIDCVLGPATDGGVYLIGLNQRTLSLIDRRNDLPVGERSLFDRIEWSTSRVLQQMIVAAERGGASLDLLPLWYDIDTQPDTDFLRGHLAVLRMTQPQLWEEVAQTRHVLDVIAKARHYNPRP